MTKMNVPIFEVGRDSSRGQESPSSIHWNSHSDPHLQIPESLEYYQREMFRRLQPTLSRKDDGTTYEVKLDNWEDEGYAFQLSLKWDQDRLWGCFDFGSYKGTFKIDKASREQPKDVDGGDTVDPHYQDLTWRGTCSQKPGAIINAPGFTKGKLAFPVPFGGGRGEVSGWFDGMPGIGLPQGRCYFKARHADSPAPIARGLLSYIKDWNALKVVQKDEKPRLIIE